MARNFGIMLFIWVATSVSYYITNFNVKYMGGNMYHNSISMAASECLSLFLAGYIFLRFGLQKAVISAFTCATFGAILILLFGKQDHDEDDENKTNYAMPIFILITRFGIGSVFGLIYLGNLIFPVKYAS